MNKHTKHIPQADYVSQLTEFVSALSHPSGGYIEQPKNINNSTHKIQIALIYSVLWKPGVGTSHFALTVIMTSC